MAGVATVGSTAAEVVGPSVAPEVGGGPGAVVGASTGVPQATSNRIAATSTAGAVHRGHARRMTLHRHAGARS